MSNNLSILDNSLILVYFAVVLFIGLFLAKNREETSKEYFLAGKNLGWLAIGASLFATNISSEHLVGLAGAGSIHGISVGHFEWLAAIILLFLGWFIAPILLKSDVSTVPQFFGKRYDDKSRLYLSLVSIFAYLFTKIGITLLMGGLVLKEILGWDMATAAILIVLLTGLYTVIGGLRSVIYTQFFQTVLLIVGAILLSVYGIIEVGGFSSLYQKLPADYFQILKPGTDPNFPWTGILLGAPIIGIWYWCADQYMVQRILSAKGIKEARKGTVLASFLKILPIFFLIFPGLIAAVLFPGSKGDASYSLMLSGDFLPMGIKGIVIIGFFSALMSSLASAFNSASSLVTLDLFSIYKPKASEHEKVLVGRLSTMFFVIATIAIIPLLKLIDTNIYIHLQAIQAYIAPPIVSVFLIGIIWKKASAKGAIWALIIGGLLGSIKIILSSVSAGWFSNIFILKHYNDINYLHFAVILFLITSIILIAYSILDNQSEDEKHQINKLYSLIDSENEFEITTNVSHFTKSNNTITKQNSETFH